MSANSVLPPFDGTDRACRSEYLAGTTLNELSECQSRLPSEKSRVRLSRAKTWLFTSRFDTSAKVVGSRYCSRRPVPIACSISPRLRVKASCCSSLSGWSWKTRTAYSSMPACPAAPSSGERGWVRSMPSTSAARQGPTWRKLTAPAVRVVAMPGECAARPAVVKRARHRIGARGASTARDGCGRHGTYEPSPDRHSRRRSHEQPGGTLVRPDAGVAGGGRDQGGGAGPGRRRALLPEGPGGCRRSLLSRLQRQQAEPDAQPQARERPGGVPVAAQDRRRPAGELRPRRDRAPRLRLPGGARDQPAAGLRVDQGLRLLRALPRLQELRADRAGQGQQVEVSMQDAVVNLIRVSLRDHQRYGRVMERAGNQLGAGVPGTTYRCHPGGPNDYVFIFVQQQMWHALLGAIDRKDLIGDARYETPDARWNNRGEVNRLVEDWTSKRPKHEAMEILARAGVPCGACLDTGGALTDPHLLAREMIVELNHPVRGRFLTVGNPIKLSASPTRITPSPLLGEHRTQILEELGYSAEKIEKLTKDGAI